MHKELFFVRTIKSAVGGFSALALLFVFSNVAFAHGKNNSGSVRGHSYHHIGFGHYRPDPNSCQVQKPYNKTFKAQLKGFHPKLKHHFLNRWLGNNGQWMGSKISFAQLRSEPLQHVVFNNMTLIADVVVFHEGELTADDLRLDMSGYAGTPLTLARLKFKEFNRLKFRKVLL